MGEVAVGCLLAILVGFLVFLLIRKLVLWYFKINEAVSALEDMADSIEEVSDGICKLNRSLEELGRSREGSVPSGVSSSDDASRS